LRAEGYHARLLEAARKQQQQSEAPLSIHDMNVVKSTGLEDLLVYDRHPRLGFIDHFLGEDTTLEGLLRGRYDERGDFAGGAYDLVDTHAGDAVEVRLHRRGTVSGREVTVGKRLVLEGSRLRCEYRLEAAGAPLGITFAPEVALTLLAGDAPDRYYRVPGRELAERKLASRGESEAGLPLELVDEWDQFLIRVSASPAAPLWRYALETASQSEGGFERTYQASIVLPVWRNIQIGENDAFECTVTVELEIINA
jgi:alpha-amylase